MSRVVLFDETGSPDVLYIVDEPTQDVGPGEVRVRIEAAGVNRLDELMRSGHYPAPFRLPHARLGCEGAGIIDAVGSGVEHVSVGDEVLIAAVPAMDLNGTYAEYTVVPSSAVIPRPNGIDAVSAAALWVAYSTAYGALIEKARLQPGNHVLITAASSPVGLAAIQIANYVGAIPLAVTRSASKTDRLLSAGAAAVFASDSENVADAVRAYTNGAGVESIVDAVAGPGLAGLARAAAYGANLVTIGWLDPRPASMPMNAPLTIHRYMSFEHVLDPKIVHRMAAFFSAGLRNGAFRPTIDTVFALDHVVDAHRRLELGDQFGKIVITI